MKLSRTIKFFPLFFLFVFVASPTWGQQNVADSIRKARQHISDSIQAVQKNRIDSLAAIRKYRASKHYKDSVADSRQQRLDSIRTERQRFFDSVKTERRRVLDSAIASRKAITDSIRAKQKHRSDSLAAISKIKNSKRYKDSVAASRKARIDSIRAVRKQYFDSVKTERRRVLDSAISARKVIIDSIRAKQKKRTDSLAVIRKYRESRRYRDSVKVVRQSRLDSIRAVRKHFSDSVIAERKERLEQLTIERKARLDSLTAVRKARMDSLKNLRDLRADSLAKKKELREKELKLKQKKREEKLKMQFELKMKKKHEAWSNEKMLKKKWGLIRQGFQNTYTRYNYYFNAKRKMQEAKLNMQRRKKDDYEKLIDLFPFDPNIDSTVFASDMDTIIRKASVGLQIHDPRTKWADDLYLLMGQAFYYKGDYENATTTFKYVVGIEKNLKKYKKKKKRKKSENDDEIVKKEQSKFKQFFQHQPVHNDAILWLTRTNADSKKESEAEAILDLLDASTKLSEKMKAKIALEKANLFVKSKDYKAAIKELDIIVSSDAITKYQRQRASFLNGQLKMNTGAFAEAEQSFNNNLALHPPIEMDFYARKNRAEAVVQGGGDQKSSIYALKKMLKDNKYAPYHEQVYFILGKLSSKNNDNEEALVYFQKSLEQAKTTKRQKAITFATMGNIQYKMGDYNLAKKSYDSASYFAKNITDIEEVNTALRRGKSLDKIELPYYELQSQDSLLRLAAMNEKEQKNVVRKYLKYLEKLKEDSVLNAQNAENSGSLANGGGATTGSWYFSSPVAVQQGYNDFKRKWGSRPLVDNWRRAASSSFGASLNNQKEDVADNKQDNGNAEEILLAAIPKTEEQLASVQTKLKRAYVDLAKAYIKDLEEYDEGIATLDSLDKRFVGHEHAAEVLLLRYTADLRQNKLEDAEKWRTKLLKDFPGSTYAQSLNAQLDTSVLASDSSVENVSTYYASTYQLANDHQYQQVLQRSRTAQRLYGDINYTRKFRILEALSLASLGEYKLADTVLKAYTKEFPSDSLRPWVDAISKYVGELKMADSLGKDSTGSRGLSLIDTATKKTIVDTSKKEKVPTDYMYVPKDKHLCVYVFGKPEPKIAGFRSGIGDYATIKFSDEDLEATLDMLNSEQSIVILKTFDNATKAKQFLEASKKESTLFREMEKGSYQTFIISENNFLRLKAQQSLDSYLKFYLKNYR